MAFSPVTASAHIYDKYRRYLRTIFSIDDPDYNHQFQQMLLDKASLAAGPFLDVSDSFAKGKSIEEMIAEGDIASDFRNIHMPLTRPLYKHQETAFRKINAGENLIVSTGTGSGKTECFLIPVLNELLRELELGALDDGVRALLIYPMNALANDQIERLRVLLADCPEITFGSYTGQTREKKEDALADYMELNGCLPLQNELISRQQIRNNPPHILVTNYAMLEYLMVRPGDSIFFSEEHANKWRFIILDEAHVYNGSSGIEVGMLLRRLKATLQNNQIQYILTSATLGDKESDTEVAAFGSRLCDSPFTKDNIIRAFRYAPKPEREMKRLPISFYQSVAKLISDNEDDAVLSAYISEYLSDHVRSGNPSEQLYDLILHDENYTEIRQVLDRPLSVQNIAGRMSWSEDELVSFVAVASKAMKNGDRLFDARYHTFLKATDSVYVTLKPNKKLFLTRKQFHNEPSGDKYCVFEIATCSVCHAMYIIGRKNENDCLVQTSAQSEAGPREAYLIRDSISDSDEDHSLEEENLKTELYELCAKCGNLHRPGKTSCGHAQEYMTKVIKVWSSDEDGTLTKCPACENVSPFGILRMFFTGQEAVTSVLGTALFEELPSYKITIRHEKHNDDDFGFDEGETIVEERTPEAKQFIAFSDNRQAAAFYASYLDQSYRNILYKRMIVEQMNLLPAGRKAESVSNFVQNLAGLFERYHLLDLSVTQSEKEAWKAVLQEMVDNNSGTSLLKTGLAAFSVPLNAVSGHKRFQLSQEDVMNMINVLLLGMMSDAAIAYDCIMNKTDREFFTFGGVENSYTFSDSDAKKYRRSFVPKQVNKTNKRADYIKRVFEKIGNPADSETIGKFMKSLWELMVSREIMKSQESTYKVNSALLEITRPDKWFVCSRCKRISPFNLHNVCPTYQCPGTLREINIPEQNRENHYYSLYNTLDIRNLRVVEHTAQLSREMAYDYQRKFKLKEIDVLSCSTTFEMGVDVGSLETVFMRNMPPSPANYAQRAGRAGRSKQASAFALTFCNKRSHDFSFFNRPEDMIRGRIDPPKFEMDNDKIAIRHVFASALAFFWRENPNYFSNAAAMVEEKSDTPVGFNSFRIYLESKPESLKRFLKRFLSEELARKYDIDHYGWLDMLLNESEDDPGVMTRAFKEYNYEVGTLKAAYQEAIKSEKYADRYLSQVKVYQREDILSFLSRKNVMPKYGFPVDTVELHLPSKSEKAKAGLQLSRDLSIAISEYAPGSQVVANGDLITSRYIRKVPGMSWKQYLYNSCKCGTLNIEVYTGSDARERMEKCRQCGEILDQRRSEVFLIPSFGFEADSRILKPGLKKPEKTYAGETSYVGYQNRIEPVRLELNGSVIEVIYGHNDEMAVLNRAGFYVCTACGYTDLDEGRFTGTKELEHHRSSGSRCGNKKLRKYAIGYRFETDVFQLRFINPEIINMEQARSILYGIMRGICSQLNIEQDDISGCIQFFRNEDTGHGNYGLIFYDRTPGGAGHVKRLKDNAVLHGTLKQTLDLMKACNCGGASMDSSCYSCLRTYYNQRYHDQLKRAHVVHFLEAILTGGSNAPNTEIQPTMNPASQIGTSGSGMHVIPPNTALSSREESETPLDLIIIKKGMNLAEQTWEEIWEYMLEEESEEGETAFYRYLLDHREELDGAEKPYKGNCLLRDVHWLKMDQLACDMVWDHQRILLFASDNKPNYIRACSSDWNCIFTEDGEKAAKELIILLKEK